jgi:hypothetical protein
MPYYHNGNLAQASGATNDSRIIPEQTIAVKLYEIVEDKLDVIEGEWAVKVARQLHSLIGRELAVNIFSNLRHLDLTVRILFTTRGVSAR